MPAYLITCVSTSVVPGFQHHLSNLLPQHFFVVFNSAFGQWPKCPFKKPTRFHSLLQDTEFGNHSRLYIRKKSLNNPKLSANSASVIVVALVSRSHTDVRSLPTPGHVCTRHQAQTAPLALEPLAHLHNTRGPVRESNPHLFRPALGPTHPPMQWVPRHSREVKRPRRGVNHPPHLAPRLKKQ